MHNAVLEVRAKKKKTTKQDSRLYKTK